MSVSLSQQLEHPIRYPERTSPPFMTKRSFWLVVLGFVLPGSAQVLAGNRKLGRVGLGATIALLLGGLLSVLGLIFFRVPTLSFFTHTIVLFVLQWVIVAYAILWVIIGFDTLRLTNLVKVGKNWRVPVSLLSVCLTVLPVAGALWMSGTIGIGRDALSSIFARGASVAPVDGRYNILLLGADAGDGRDGLRPDSISVVSVDAKTGQSTIIGLPRELTGMPFPEDSPMHEQHPTGFGNDWGCYIGRCYMNGLYTEISIFDPDRYAGVAKAGEEPGILALVDAASGATGLDVQFYVLIDMDGFSDLIDALGGVDINVQQRLPIGGDAHGNGIEGWIEAGQQHMNGFNAQWYARSRYTTDDYDRMRRQRELQEAILAQMNPVNVLKQFKGIVETGSSIVWTNMPESMLGPFLDLATRAKDHTPVTVELTPPEVQPEAPDYDYIHELVADAVRQASPAEEEE